MNDNAVTVRRIDIAGYVSEHDTIQLEDTKVISDALNIPYETVRNDAKFLRKKEDEVYKNYNLIGLRRKGLNKITQFENMIKRIDTILSKPETKDEVVIKTVLAKAQLLLDLHNLEHDGVGVITIELESRENDKVGNKSN